MCTGPGVAGLKTERRQSVAGEKRPRGEWAARHWKAGKQQAPRGLRTMGWRQSLSLGQ